MVSDFLRKILSFLSFWYPNDLNSIKNKDKNIIKTIQKKLNKIHFNKKNLKNTHNLFNKKIFDEFEPNFFFHHFVFDE